MDLLDLRRKISGCVFPCLEYVLQRTVSPDDGMRGLDDHSRSKTCPLRATYPAVFSTIAIKLNVSDGHMKLAPGLVTMQRSYL